MSTGRGLGSVLKPMQVEAFSNIILEGEERMFCQANTFNKSAWLFLSVVILQCFFLGSAFGVCGAQFEKVTGALDAAVYLTNQTPSVAFAIWEGNRDGPVWIYPSGTGSCVRSGVTYNKLGQLTSYNSICTNMSCSISNITYNGLGQRTGYEADCTINGAPVKTQLSGTIYNTLGQVTAFAEQREYPDSGCVYQIAMSNVSYTLSGYVENFDVNVVPPIATYTVTPSASTGGNISPSTPQPVELNGIATFTVTPDNGNIIRSIDGTCGGNLTGNTYTTNPITTDCTVVATFGIEPCWQCLPTTGGWRAIIH